MRTGEVSLQLAPVNGQGWLGHFVGFCLAITGIGTCLFARHFIETTVDFDRLSRVGGMPVGLVVFIIGCLE